MQKSRNTQSIMKQKYYSIETNPEMAQMTELGGKDLKIVILTCPHVQNTGGNIGHLKEKHRCLKNKTKQNPKQISRDKKATIPKMKTYPGWD